MKHTKRIFAILLSVAMVMTMMIAMSATAFAVDEGADKSITITSPSGAKADDTNTYKIYKVFDAATDGTSISYKLLPGKTTAPAGFTVDDSGNVYLGTVSDTKTDAAGEIKIKVGGATKYLVPQTTELTAEQISAVKAYVEAEGLDPVATTTITGASKKSTVDVGSYGYFFITTTTGTVVTIDSTKKDAKVNDKNVVPTLDKDIASVTPVNGNGGESGHTAGADNEAGQSATASVGDTVNYTVKIKAQKGAENYIFHDKLSAGLTLKEGSLSVTPAKYGESNAATYTTTKFANETDDSKDDITLTFAKGWLDTITEETEITITYSAIVNENAVIAGDGNKNTGTLDYGHDPDDSTKPGETTPPDEPVVYAYEFQLVKDNASKTILTGAEFKLYADAGCTKEIPVIASGSDYKVKDATSSSTAATVISAGTPKIIGLGNGTYYLKETKAPDGYNLLNDPVEVTINNANNDATISGTTYSEGGVEVVNQAGSELPATGGIGTVIFYVLGSALLIGCGVVLVSKRRMRKEK